MAAVRSGNGLRYEAPPGRSFFGYVEIEDVFVRAQHLHVHLPSSGGRTGFLKVKKREFA